MINSLSEACNSLAVVCCLILVFLFELLVRSFSSLLYTVLVLLIVEGCEKIYNPISVIYITTSHFNIQTTTWTRRSKEPVSLTLVFVHIKQRTHDKIVFWCWWCVCRSYFTGHSCRLQLSLSLINLAQKWQLKIICKNLQEFTKLTKIVKNWQ